MSKGNMLLGQARGKVGSLVFSRADGKQIVRSRAEVVKNPQTTAQMVQRIILNTITQAYSKMSVITDHSFEGVPAGQKSMSYFMKRNLNLLRQTLAEIGDFSASAPMFSPLGTNGLASNTYVVAKGQLPEIIPAAVSTGGIAITLAENTYAGAIAAFGAQRGDQVTIVSVSGQNYTNQKFSYSRIILDPRNADGTAAELSVPFIVDGAINLPSDRNENTGHVYSLDGSDFIVSDSFGATNMAAAILSRQKTDGEWMRSNAALILAEGAAVGFNMEQSLEALAGGGIDVENPLYLNNAKKNAAQRTSPSPSPTPTPGDTEIASFTKDGDAVAQGSTLRRSNFEEGGSPIAGSVSNPQSGVTYKIAAVKSASVGATITEGVADYVEVLANGGFSGNLDVNNQLPDDEPTAIVLLANDVCLEIWCSLVA